MLPEYLDIPLFPLPNVTFFPRTTLPLHIFEPRYRTLIANCIAGDRLLGVPLLRPGWQENYFGRPPICRCFGVGRIVDHVAFENGNFNVVVEGMERVRMMEEYPTEAYRTARVQVMQDPAIDRRRGEITAMMKEITSLGDELCLLMPQGEDAIRSALFSHPHPLVVVDKLAALLVVDAYDRQSMLEELDPMRRMRLMLIQLHMIRAQLTDQPSTHEMAEEEME